MTEDPAVLHACRRFGVGRVAAVEPRRGTFNLNWKVTAADRAFILKRRPAADAARSAAECAVSEMLRGEGIPSPRVRLSDGGEPVLVRDGYCYTMSEYVGGRGPDHSDGDLALLAAALAAMHAATADEKGLRLFRRASLKEWRVAGWAEQLAGKFATSSGAGGEEASYLRRQLRASLARVAEVCSAQPLPQSFVHWDFHPGNVVIGPGDAVFVFDHEYTHPDDRVADVANSVILLAALNSADVRPDDAASFIQPCRIDPHRARVFLRAYSAARPLAPAEIEALPAYLNIAWIGWCLYTFDREPATRTRIPDATCFPRWLASNAAAVSGLL